MEYIDMTPTWEEILPMWKRIMEAVDDGSHQNPGQAREAFWKQVTVMAKAADKWNAHCKEQA